jgi:hypothetical protein
MAPRNFSLIDLIPEPDTFTDRDGSQYEVRSTRDFSATDLARLSRLQKAVQRSAGNLDADDEEESEMAATSLDQAVNHLFGMVVPALPEERRGAIPLNHKMAFLNWWQEQQPTAAPNPARAAKAPRVIRGRRSPDSSNSTD